MKARDHFGIDLAVIQITIVAYLLYQVSTLSNSLKVLGLSLTGIPVSYTIPAVLLLIMGATFLIKSL